MLIRMKDLIQIFNLIDSMLLSSLMVLDHGLVMVQFGCTHLIMNVGDRNTFVPLLKKTLLIAL